MTTNHEPLELITPELILNQSSLLNPIDSVYLSNKLINRFGSPEQPIYVDESVESKPIIMPIYNGHLKLVQCAIMQDGEIVELTSD